MCCEPALPFVVLCFATPSASERSMGLRVRVCVRQWELWDVQGFAKSHPPKFSPAKYSPYNPPPPLPEVRFWMHPVNGTGNSPSPGRPAPGVVKQDKSSGGSVDTTKTRSDPQRVRMSGGERPIGAAKGTQPNTEALCQPPPPRMAMPCVARVAGIVVSRPMREHRHRVWLCPGRSARRWRKTLGPVEGDDKSGLSWQGLHE